MGTGKGGLWGREGPAARRRAWGPGTLALGAGAGGPGGGLGVALRARMDPDCSVPARSFVSGRGACDRPPRRGHTLFWWS